MMDLHELQSLMFEITVEDLETLPDGCRYELYEGNLYMLAPVTLWHSQVGWRLANAFVDKGQTAIQTVGVKLGPRTSMVADVAAFVDDDPDLSRAIVLPQELALVVEIVSPSSADDDRHRKPRRYAKAGIHGYWRVERSQDDKNDAVIYQHQLVRPVDGDPVYIESGVTTLKQLEADAKR